MEKRLLEIDNMLILLIKTRDCLLHSPSINIQIKEELDFLHRDYIVLLDEKRKIAREIINTF